METDREVLIWFHQRLVFRHKESELVDYMRRLRWIISATNPTKVSRGKRKKTCNNNLKELGEVLKKKSEFELMMINEV